MGFFGGLYTFSFAVATIIAYVLALGLPPDHVDGLPNPALKEDSFWRVIYAMPIPCYVAQWVMTTYLMKYEAPKFLLVQIENARKEPRPDDAKIRELETQLAYMVTRIYEGVDSPAKVKPYTDYISTTISRDTAACTLKEAFTLPQYKYGSWVGLFVMFFHQSIGMGAIMMYSNALLDSMSGPGAALTPR